MFEIIKTFYVFSIWKDEFIWSNMYNMKYYT